MAAVEKLTCFGERQLFSERTQFLEIFALELEFRFQPEAGTRFWPQILCFRGKIRSFYLFEGMGSFSQDVFEPALRGDGIQRLAAHPRVCVQRTHDGVEQPGLQVGRVGTFTGTRTP